MACPLLKGCQHNMISNIQRQSMNLLNRTTQYMLLQKLFSFPQHKHAVSA